MNGSPPLFEEPAAGSRVQLTFIDPRGWLTGSSVTADRYLRDHLAHRISRNPADLHAHVQRILLCVRARLSDELYGALLDLFIALGNKGQQLRARLLALCHTLLQVEQLVALGRGAVRGIAATDVMPETEHSRLSAGLHGRLALVALVETEQLPVTLNVLEEARELLDTGRILEARELLEQTLLDDPQDLAASQELLAIYRHTRDLAGLRSMMEKTVSAPLAAQEEWQALAAVLEAMQASAPEDAQGTGGGRG